MQEQIHQGIIATYTYVAQQTMSIPLKLLVKLIWPFYGQQYDFVIQAYNKTPNRWDKSSDLSTAAAI